MFKLPVCPYCNTIYRYKDVKEVIREKNHRCYHCGKAFKVTKKRKIVLYILIIFVAIISDIIELSIFKNTNFVALTITNIVIILVFQLFIPFFIKYEKYENTDKDNLKKSVK